MLKITWRLLKEHGVAITVLLTVIILIIACYGPCSDWLKMHKDKEVKFNLLAKVELNLCESIMRDMYCPIFMFDAMLGNTDGLDKDQAHEVNDIFEQVRSFKTSCLNMDDDTRRNTVTTLYNRAWNLRKTGIVVRPRFVEMAIDTEVTPPPNMTFEEAADKCHGEIKDKSTIQGVRK